MRSKPRGCYPVRSRWDVDQVPTPLQGTPERRAEARAMREKGATYRAIGKHLGITHFSAARWVNEEPRRKSLEDRFWAKVEKGPTCWLWTGSKFGNGYGQFTVGPRHICAHRVAYVLAHGSIPRGETIHHQCRNRACVRPDHLEAMTLGRNIEQHFTSLYS